MPITKVNQKAQARYHYFTSAGTQKEIARAVGVSEKTMSTWVRNGKWASQKAAALYSPAQETNHLYEQLREINSNIESRPKGLRYGTREELLSKAKIITMITHLKKNTADDWRNVNADADFAEMLAENQIPNYFHIKIGTPNSGRYHYDSDLDPKADSYKVLHGIPLNRPAAHGKLNGKKK